MVSAIVPAKGERKVWLAELSVCYFTSNSECEQIFRRAVADAIARSCKPRTTTHVLMAGTFGHSYR